MAHRGLFSRKVVTASAKKPKRKVVKPTTAISVETSTAESPPQSSAGTKKRKWGTPEERYRRLCLQCLMCRMFYYVHSTSVISDDVYDRLEKTILQIENKHRELIHPDSPTGRPGSDNEKDYPASARVMYIYYKDYPEAWERVEKAISSSIEETREAFSLDSKNQKNSEKTS